jgi:hypothetical protein
MSNILAEFIKDASKAGKTREEINNILRSAGWPEDQLQSYWAKYHDAPFPIPVPKPALYASPRLTTLNLFYFIVLYISIYSIVSIIFTFLDYHLPDGLGRNTGLFYSHQPLAETIRSYLSAVLVCVPLVVISHTLLKKSMAAAGQFIPAMRLKLLNLTLLLAAIVMLCNFIGFVYYFLSGELSLRFIIKVVVLSALSAGLYFYFKPEMSANEQKGNA